jgi:RimJ/RimL family protein N-acetyltransferase
MTLERGTNFIETERLLLRRIVPADFGFFARLHADPDVTRFIGPGRPRTAGESDDWLRSTIASYDSCALGQLAVVRKSDGALIGRCGLAEFVVDVNAGPGLPRAWFQRSAVPPGLAVDLEPELGYTFDKACWGNGYASEAARRVFDYAIRVLRLPRAVSVIHPDNAASLRVARRFALERDGSVQMDAAICERYLWPATI